MSKSTLLNNPTNSDQLLKRVRVQKHFDNVKSLTEQHHKDSCDIKIIMHKAQKTGMVNHLSQHAGKYTDLASRPDYQESMNIIANAQSIFESIPSQIREKFNNEPSQFLDFIQNKDNREEMLKLGFTDEHLPPVEIPTQEPLKVSVVETIQKSTEE